MQEFQQDGYFPMLVLLKERTEDGAFRLVFTDDSPNAQANTTPEDVSHLYMHSALPRKVAFNVLATNIKSLDEACRLVSVAWSTVAACGKYH